MEAWTQLRELPTEQRPAGGRHAGRSSSARAEVMAVVRDEMRTPLLGLEALADALADSRLSPELSERMHSHSRVLAQRVSLLIEDLALVASHDSAAIAMDFRVLDLDEQLQAGVDSFPDVLVRVGGDRGLRVRADALRFQQILANLLRNAQRRTSRPVTVLVSDKAQFVSVRFVDAGPQDDHQLQIVDTLVRAHGGM